MTTAPPPRTPLPPIGPAGRAIAVVVVAAVVVTSAIAMLRFAAESADPPTARAVAEAAAHVRTLAPGAGDVVLVAPPWSMHALQQLGGDDGLGPRILPADGPWDLLHRGRHRRVLLWREPDATPWLEGRSHPVLATAQVQTFDTIAIAEVKDATARFDLLVRFDDATIVVEDTSAPCTERSQGAGGGVRCAGQPRQVRVAREWAQVTENGQPVVVVQPPAGRGLRLRIDGVEIGERLVVAAGHTRNALARLQEKKVAGGTITVTVVVDDVVVGTLVRRPTFRVEPHRRAHVERFVGPRDPDGGFTATTLDTRAVAGVNRRLSFIVSADHADGNAIGLDAFVPGD